MFFFLLIEHLRSIIEDLARTLKKKPDQKLCSSCPKKKTEKNKEVSEAEENNDDKEYLPSPNPETTLNQTVEILQCSPLKSVSQRDKISYGKRKVSQLYAASAEMINDVLDVSTDDTTDHKTGFSKFCQLRPKWGVTVDSSSEIHSVCVCEIHQNSRLIYAAIPGKTDYKEFLSKFVCNTSNRDCMLHSSICCPNLNEVEKYLLNLFEKNNFGTEDTVNVKQWMQKEREISLVNCTLKVEEFVKEICNNSTN